MTETKTEAPIGPQTHRPLPESMQTIERLLVTGEIVELHESSVNRDGYGRYRWATPGELLDMCEMQCANQLDEIKRLRAAAKQVAKVTECLKVILRHSSDVNIVDDQAYVALSALGESDPDI